MEQEQAAYNTGPTHQSNMTNHSTHAQKEETRSRSKWKTICCAQFFSVIIFAIGIGGGILIGIYAYHGGPDGDKDITKCPTNGNQQTAKMDHLPLPKPTNAQRSQPRECPNVNPIKHLRYEDSIYAPLTISEMNIVSSFLLSRGIITTLQPPTGLHESFISYQSISPPVKKEALQYLDKGGRKPDRYAKVTVQRGAEDSPDMMEYKVGPLGSGVMTAVAMTQSGETHFNSRPYENVELGIMQSMLAIDLEILKPLIEESFDGATYPGDLTVNLLNGPPTTTGTTRNTRWCATFKGFGHVEDIDLIHILPLSGTVHNPGTNTSEWYSYDFHYLNQGPYSTAAELMTAYNNDDIRKVKLPSGYKNTLFDRIFPKRDSTKPLREHADIPGPRTYNPSGPRYEIRGTNVKWMGWNFDISGGQTRGPALFNIKYKNERIIYEHAVNDIALNYAMDSHAQNNIIYTDATYGIMGGDTPSTVMSGLDCPEHGTVLNSSFWWHATQKAYDMRTYCIFEADGQEALWRHAGIKFEAGMRNRYLVVRVPTVVGNYDYTFDFHFYLDGKIFTMAKASGYIQSSFWDENNENNPNAKETSRDAFGYKLEQYQTGPVHDHIFAFKVDMDIIDENNTFQIIKWKAGPPLEALKTQTNITEAPSYFKYNEIHYIEWEKIAKEAAMQGGEEQHFWLMVNERKKNKWGVERGYQIEPMATGNQVLRNHPILKTVSFTKYHCAVTKRKEDEPTVSTIYDANRMDQPKLYLDKQLDGEDIIDEDIVNWVTVGFLHVPTTEDMPMTVRVQTGFLIRPFNFFDRTDTFDMPQFAETEDHTVSEREPEYDQCEETKTEYCRFC